MGLIEDINDTINPFRWGADKTESANRQNNDARLGLNQNAIGARDFATMAQNQYQLGTQQLQGYYDHLRDQASGRRSLSAEQLRQGLQNQLGAQQSFAASAAPRDAAMAARTAAIQGGRARSAMSGQAALAGIQERNAANQLLGQSLLGQRGQDLQGTLGGYNASNQALTGGINPLGDKTWAEQNAHILGGIQGGASALSDKRQKEDIADGDEKAKKLLDGLKAYTFKYKRGARELGAGEGEHLGIMAQDLEKVAPEAVVETKHGKVVHGAKLATALAAATSNIHKRLSKLELEERNEAPTDPLPKATARIRGGGAK